MTVFIVQENSKFDYTPALSYGEIKFMSSKEFSVMPNSLINVEIISKIKQSAQEFDPSCDYLLLSGDPIQIALSYSMFANKAAKDGATTIAVLKWNSRINQYHKVLLPC